MSSLQMIRMDLDYDALLPLAQENIEVARALEVAAREIKYNSRLYDFLEMAYPWQRKAIELTADHRVIGLISANQVGKSETAMSVVACLATGIIPDWWKGRKYDRPVKIMVAGVDSNHNKNVLMEKLIGVNNWRIKRDRGSGQIPKDYIVEDSAVTVRGDDLASIQVAHVSGGTSQIIFRAYSQGREAAQGFQADIIVIDEQPKDAFWSEALVRTASTGGFVLCTFTPLLGMTGLVETLMNLQDLEGSPRDKYGAKYKSDQGWALVRASWEDIEHIGEEEKIQLRKGFAPYERDARTFGIPIAGHGRIIPYTKDQMIYDIREVQIRDEWPHLIGIDIGHGHGRDPSAVIMVAWDEINDVIYVTNAEVGYTDTVADLRKMITSVDHRPPVAWPSDAGKVSMNAPSSVAEQLREQDINLLGFPFLNPKGADGKSNNFKAPGIAEINERFAEGRLKISSEADKLLYQIEQYQYTETGKIQDGTDDMVDAMRYAIMSIIQGYGAGLREEAWQYSSEDEEFNFQTY